MLALRVRPRISCPSSSAVRSIHVQADSTPPPTAAALPSFRAKKEGDISSVFSSLSGAATEPLPLRFAELKRAIIGSSPEVHAQLFRSWKELLDAVKIGVEEIQQKGSDIIPEVPFEQLAANDPSATWTRAVRKRGVVIVRDVVEDEQALAWKEQVKAYIKANPKSKGYPADNPQVYEIYWSKPQLKARSHANMLRAQTGLMKLFHADPESKISLNTPITYVDRLRIRLPGDSKFALGPHIDGGSLERWEDPTYRKCYSEILSGRWQEHDPWDMGRRVGIKSDLYDGPSQCSVFRAFQGWLSLSSTGPTEGTLRVFPLLKEASAYVLLRPFFRPTLPPSSPSFLSASSWKLDLETPAFPNSVMGCGQELSNATHPHLRLDEGGMVSMKKVNPGDAVFWHCDGIHAVEKEHRGKGDSSVFYIPVTPLTKENTEYLARQKAVMMTGVPPPDFPGGAGEMGFVGVGTLDDVANDSGKKALGLASFGAPTGLSNGETKVVEEAHKILGF